MIRAKAKTAIVTGAARGLGLELCRTLARRGYRVAMLSRDAECLEAAAAVVRSNTEVLALAGDVTDAKRVREAVAQVEASWGPIDLAIANAGIRHETWADDFPLDWSKRLMETNYFGMLHLFDAVVPGMVARGRGCFAGIASIAGIRCLPGGSGYGASKAAAQAFLDTVRLELRPRGIQVVTVNPWFIRTPSKDDGVPRPFVVEPDWAAAAIVDGIEAGKVQIEFPRVPSIAWKLVRLLPNAAFAWLFGPRRGRSSLGLQLLRIAGRKSGR